MNPALAPRVKACTVCREVAAVEHVTMMLYDEDGGHLPASGAIDYVRSIGMAGSNQSLYAKIATHRKHVDAWIARGSPLAPVDGESGVVRIPPPAGPTRWIDAQQVAMDLGNDALRDLRARMDAGTLDTRDMIALAKLGVTTANVRGQMEQRGKALSGIDRLLQLAAGGSAGGGNRDAS